MNATVVIPVTAPTTRIDGVPLPPEQIARIDFELTLDGGQSWHNVGHCAGTETSYTLQGLDVGTYSMRDFVTDTQVPPKISAHSEPVSFVVQPEELAPPNPAVLGTPTVNR